jgi:hypothetical protein
VTSSVVMDVMAVIENKSKFSLFFKLCNDLCERRVAGALAKRHGSNERVDHVTSINELHRLMFFNSV